MGGFAPRRRLGAGLVLLAMSVAGLQAPADGAPHRAGGYRVVVLPFEATALSDKGVVVGNLGSWPDSRAVTWQHGRVRALPLPEGATSSSASAVNVHGVVGGSAFVPGAGSHAVVWVRGRPRWLPESAPIWEEDGPTTSRVDAINDHGDVVGTEDRGVGDRLTWWLGAAGKGRPKVTGSGRLFAHDMNNAGVTVGAGESLTLAAVWRQPGGIPTNLAPWSQGEVVWSGAYSINDAGLIVGSEFADDGDGRGAVVRSLLWRADGGAPSALPQPADGGLAIASLINNRGVIVGTYSAAEGGASEVAYWAGPRVVRTGIAGYPVDLDDKGAMIVRDGTRSLFVSPWGSRRVRVVAPVTVPRGASRARTSRALGEPELRVLRRQACDEWPSPRPCHSFPKG